jgi:hypothetical protein
MFTSTPRSGTHLRAAARQAAARPRRLAAALAAVTCALLASAVVPAASAADLVRDPPGGAPLAPVPAPAAPVVTVGGMPGWQITLIAISAAVVTAIAAVFLDRCWPLAGPPPHPPRDALSRPRGMTSAGHGL